MLENSIYSVISPEGCASILWRDPGKSLEAAEAMKLSAQDLLKLGVIDEIVEEPVGGAHRNYDQIAINVKESILRNLDFFEKMSKDQIYEHRKNKFLKIGREKGFITSSSSNDKGLVYNQSLLEKVRILLSEKKYLFGSFIIIIIVSLLVLTQ